MPELPPYDPYAEQPPSFLEKNFTLVCALAAGLGTALLTVLSFPPYNVPEFAYAFAIPAIFWAYERPAFRIFAPVMLGGQAVAWTILLGWLHHVSWLGLFLLGPFVGVWTGLWFLGAWWLLPRMRGRQVLARLLAMLGLAGLWVLVEWTRSWFLGGFPWLPLAASQWQRSAVLQVAAYTGAWGVSFVLIVFNVGFATWFHHALREGTPSLRRRPPEFMFALIVLMFATVLPLSETFHRGTFARPLARIAFVQPDIPQAVKWDPARGPAILEILKKTTLDAAAGDPDFILWPEATTPWAVRGDENVRAWVEGLVCQTRVPLVLGSDAIENPGRPDEAWYNAAFVVDPKIGLQPDYYAKRQLVPFGEFVPLRPVLGWLKKIVPIGDDDYSRGRAAQPLVVNLTDRTVTLGPLICYEDIFPALARDNALTGADALVVLTNNAWFGEGGAAYQHAAHSVLRAVETRRPVLRCGNAGWSGWIDEFGGVRAVLQRDPGGELTTDPKAEDGTVYFRGAETVDVSRDARWIGRQSYYVQHGDWFVAWCAVLALLGAAAVSIGQPPAPHPAAAEENEANWARLYRSKK
ncbi:MAG TPA: apolipoprotein N-acyltransferase [Opitutaceae bacterium]|nr:apolipoprotein N-acyltransferase [Opitutaceae bacterium]